MFAQLQQPPTDLDYDQQAWSPTLLLHYIQEEYGVEYSEGHAPKLLSEAGLDKEAEFQQTVEKRPKLTDKTVVVVDQIPNRVGTVRRRGYYSIGSNPTIEASNAWGKVTVLSAVTEDGDSFYCWTEANLISRQGVWLLGALQERFGEELVMLLDRAGYFYNRDL